MVGLPDEHIALVVVADSPSVVDALAGPFDAALGLAPFRAMDAPSPAGFEAHFLAAGGAMLDDRLFGLGDVETGRGTIAALPTGALTLVGVDGLAAGLAGRLRAPAWLARVIQPPFGRQPPVPVLARARRRAALAPRLRCLVREDSTTFRAWLFHVTRPPHGNSA